MIDIKAVRHDTPSCNNIVHLNNAGASLSPQTVNLAIWDHFQLEQEIGGYEAANQSVEKLEKFYKNAGQLINCSSDEIAFVENATRAWDMAFYSIPFEKGDQVITSHAEYASNYIALLQQAKKYEIEIVVVPDDEHGQIDLEELKKKIGKKTKLVALTHAPTSNGLINPAAEVGQIAKENDSLYLLDACQSLGQIAIDVEKIGCDFLSGTGRKYLRGPRATGLLYVKKSVLPELEPPFLDLHSARWTSLDSYEVRSDARKFETWESFVAGKLGLSEAIAYCSRIGIDKIESRTKALAQKLRRLLKKVDGVNVLDRGKEKSGIVTFITQMAPDELHIKLQRQNCNTSVTDIESARLDLEPHNLTKVNRASVHYFNTEEEIEKFIEIISTILVK